MFRYKNSAIFLIYDIKVLYQSWHKRCMAGQHDSGKKQQQQGRRCNIGVWQRRHCAVRMRRVAVIKARQRVMWRHSKHDTHNPAIIIPLALITGRVQSKLVEYEAYLSLSRCKLDTFDLSLRLHKQRTQGFADCNMKTGRERELMESAKPRWRHDMSHAVNDLIKWTNWPDLAPITSAWPMVTV